MASDTFNTGAGNVGNANQQGKNAIGSFDPSSYATSTMTGLNDIIGGQNNTQNQYQNAFKSQIASQPTTTQAYQTGQQIYNVQPLQDQANALTNAVLKAPITDLNAAKGFNYDSNQVEQKQNQDLMYLTPQANAAQNNATTAQQNATNYANLQYEQNQMNILPEQEQGQFLMEQYAAQQTGWTTAQSQQLQALQDKMDQGVALSSAEMQSYAQLSSAESSYQGALASANAAVQAAKINNQNVTLPAGSTYLNPTTGKAYNPFATPARP